jgi:hypothetical protein
MDMDLTDAFIILRNYTNAGTRERAALDFMDDYIYKQADEPAALRAEVARLRRGLEAIVDAEEWTGGDTSPYTWAIVEVYRALGRAPSDDASEDVKAEYEARLKERHG